eukprot:scaffold2319_cov248-Pinguiococcus_pyrenoidosus.AAC.17
MKSRVRFYGTRLEALEDVHTSTPVFEAQLRSLAPKREVASGRWPTDRHRGRVRAKLRAGGTDQAKGLPLLRVRGIRTRAEVHRERLLHSCATRHLLGHGIWPRLEVRNRHFLAAGFCGSKVHVEAQ